MAVSLVAWQGKGGVSIVCRVGTASYTVRCGHDSGIQPRLGGGVIVSMV